jgi:hypothetical protein
MTVSTQPIVGAESRRSCRSFHCGPFRRTAIYRLYDAEERLLYAGIAYDVERRWQEHARDKPWWGEVRWKTALWHESRLGAAVEEFCAIKYENPRHNDQRDYDRRLGVEPTLCAGKIEPRPAPFWALHYAMGQASQEHQGLPDYVHYAAVISPIAGDPEDAYRVWVPQLPELGARRCLAKNAGPVNDNFSGSDWIACCFYDRARSLIAEHVGDDEFTVTVHHADGCPGPGIDRAGPRAEPLDAPGNEEVPTRWGRFVRRLLPASVELQP